ncbi:hypothetical protein HDV05_004830 [Chytridiales sp. JEL 0842]|nr:hypothetical protein HDV05_004830 [Chytridiales sp. JEL 0842]
MTKGRKPFKSKKNTKQSAKSKPQGFVSKGARGGTFYTPMDSSISMFDLLQNTLSSSTDPSLRKQTRYLPSHTILLVGEGDFSFSNALTAALNLPRFDTTTGAKIARTSDDNLVVMATSHDSLSTLQRKYPNCSSTLHQLRSTKGVNVHHNVDATTMSADPRISTYTYDRIVFNFPHVGGGKQEDVEVNKNMLSLFFGQCRKLLKNLVKMKGEVHVALRQTSFYDKFAIVELAEGAGLELKEKADFDTERWAALGYKPVRTEPAAREAPSMDAAKLFVFVPSDIALAEEENNAGEEDDEEDEDEDTIVEDEELPCAKVDSSKKHDNSKPSKKSQRDQKKALKRKERQQRQKKAHAVDDGEKYASNGKHQLVAPSKSERTSTLKEESQAKQTLPPSKLRRVKEGLVSKKPKRVPTLKRGSGGWDVVSKK